MPKVLITEKEGYRIYIDTDLENYTSPYILYREYSGESSQYKTFKLATEALKRRIKLRQKKVDPVGIITHGRTALVTSFIPNSSVRIVYSPHDKRDPAWSKEFVYESGLIKDTSFNRVTLLEIEDLKEQVRKLEASMERISLNEIKTHFGWQEDN